LTKGGDFAAPGSVNQGRGSGGTHGFIDRVERRERRKDHWGGG